jgi:hypothetical protein
VTAIGSILEVDEESLRAELVPLLRALVADGFLV